ncbi:hypothetical protein KFK09_013806 [Dendrobium nobile]|uniref:Uncharacterized protein n=1 Tax=Dendrobium nobile TaxID=94219 RepID=A0A8T3BA37_DENNO|nr:hypothetical protein KFK09_013806 [Dendrobium nobile]
MGSHERASGLYRACRRKKCRQIRILVSALSSSSFYEFSFKLLDVRLARELERKRDIEVVITKENHS